MPIIEKAIYITICTATIVEPTGVLAKIEITIPTREQKTDKTTEHTVTDLKLLNRHIADSDGKTISAEIKREERSDYESAWFDIDTLPKLAYDHEVVINNAIELSTI